MSSETPSGAPLSRGLRVALIVALVAGGAALLIALGSMLLHPGPEYRTAQGPAGSSTTAVTPGGAAPVVSVLPPLAAKGGGEPAPDTAFKDAAGKAVKVADFKGKVVVMNLWATWCGPCRKEMPTLAALSALTASQPVKVLAVSVDSASKTDAAKAFIAEHKPLDFFQDVGPNMPFALKPAALGFPTTVIFDKTGRERTRMAGDLDWSSGKVRKVIDQLAAE